MSKATRVVVDGVNYPLDDTTAVDFSEAQSLSAAEKQQACTNIGLGNVDDTSDANKPISIAQQTALNAKLDTANVYNGLDKTAAGYALDARQGKALNDSIAQQAANIGIVETGSTCTHTGGIPAGAFVMWQGAMYTADTAISVGETLAASGGSKNLTACPGGGLNEVVKTSDVDSLFTVRAISASIVKANGSRSSVTAPQVSGYSFICWLCAVSNGWIGNVYIENPLNNSSNIWSANYGYSDTSNGNVAVYALYIKAYT